jgi:hypothetical protein
VERWFLARALLWVVAATPGFQVEVAGSLTNVPRRGGFAREPSAELAAARNEYESLQVVVRAHRAITELSATADAPIGPGGARLPPPRLYRVGYVTLTTPSNLEGGTGEYPDPLIPAVDSLVGERRRAFPVAVAAGDNQPIWVEVYVPESARPGSYRGAVELSADNERMRVPLTVTVHRFALPRAPTLSILVAFSGLSLERAHRGRYLSDDDNRALSRRYASALIAHRLSPIGGTMLPPPHQFDDREVTVDWSAYDAEIAPLLAAGARMVDLRISPKVDGEERAALVRAWARHFHERGWDGRLFDYTADEPKPSAFAALRARARAVQAAGIPRLVTHPFEPTLAGVVDIFAPVVNHVDDRPSEPRPPPRSAYGAARVFWYQSCLSHGCDIVGGDYFRGWPSYVIDAPPVAQRIMEWLTYRYRIDGELYYNSVEAYQSGDPWAAPHLHGGSGDGTLFYPGTPARIGGKTDIPVASIRLARIRDGAEDYEYLALAGRAIAEPVVAKLCRRTFDWEHDPRALLQARARLANALEVAKPNGVTEAHTGAAH